jgi:molybdopterin/thiamine biosynthesis adenylyltransferase
MDHTRHSGIFNVPTYFNVGLVGAGGIGAMTALVLAKMGVRQLTVWDDDTVSDENIPTQWHRVSDIGNPKVFSLQRSLEEFSDEIMFEGKQERIHENSDFERFNLLVSAVDSITARQNIWGAVTRSMVDWYVDARMAAEEFQAFIVNTHDLQVVERYHAMLMSLNENDIPDMPCTEKATFFCASIAAGHIGAILRNIIRNEQESHRIIHYIPQFHVLSVNL